MISTGTYIKILLKKRNMSQMDLVRKMQALGFDSVNKFHLNNVINNTRKTPDYVLLRKIEIALGLEDFTLVNMTGIITKTKRKQLEKIEVKKK